MVEPVPFGARGARSTTTARRPGRWRSAEPSERGPARCCGAGRHAGRTAPGAPHRPGRREVGGAGVRHVWERRGSSSPVDTALVVGEQGVVVGRRGEQPLGQAEHDNQVEVEADAHAHRPDQHALAHAPDPAEVGLELELQGAGEDVEVDRLLDRIEAGQPVEGPLHPLGRLLLRPSAMQPRRRLAAEQIAQVSAGPGGPLAPGLWLGRRCSARSSINPSTNSRRRARPFGRRRAACSARHGGASGSSSAALRFAVSARWRRSANRWSQSSRPATTPASRDSRSHAVTGIERPSWRRRPPASQANTSSRRNPLSGRARSPSRVRPTTRAVSGMTAAPLRAMPAAASCSWANRA